MSKIAAFIDFQGTLGGGGVDDIKTLEFYPFSIEAIRLLNLNDILVIGITNQSHISKGEVSMEEYLNKLQELKCELALQGAYFDEVYCCPHTDKDGCKCRKPLTGMIDKAIQDFAIDINKSYVIGDMGMSDMILAKAIGSKGILVLTGVGKGSINEYRYTWKNIEADYIAENVLEATQWILSDICPRK